MGAIQIKNVPEELHEAIRSRAAEEGKTVSAYVLDLIRHDLEVPTMRAWLARLGNREPVRPFDSAAAVQDMRAEWDRELAGKTGAPPPEDDDAAE
jgi:plasmid stability protein